MISNVRLSELIEDRSLYPRHNIDEVHVADLARALASGATLPPIIAEGSTRRVVDGFHRRRALLQVLGDDAVAPVECRDYASESALFLEAVALNSVHGRRLDRHDQTRIVLRLREFGIADDIISVTLHVPEPIVQTLSLRIVLDADGQTQPSKRGFEHLRGTTLSHSQMDAMGSVRSGEIGRLCIEMTKLLENRLVDLSDEKITKQLAQLRAVIGAALESVAA